MRGEAGRGGVDVQGGADEQPHTNDTTTAAHNAPTAR
jgi:hypothetical protein